MLHGPSEDVLWHERAEILIDAVELFLREGKLEGLVESGLVRLGNGHGVGFV